MSKVNISEQALDQQVAQLPLEVLPQRDLWTGVERAITRYEQKATLNTSNHKIIPLAWAASFLVVVLLTWGVVSPPKEHISSPLTLASIMESNFEQNIMLILTSYDQAQNKVLPIAMQKQFNELSSARAAINRALEQDPTNNDLLNLLKWTHRQELALMQQVYSPQWQTI